MSWLARMMGLGVVAGGLGPVFAFEWIMTARRWQMYAMRSITVVALLGAMGLVWSESVGFTDMEELSIEDQTEVARTFFGATSLILLGLVGLAAPAAAAGAVCLDKARGNLTLLFATDLTDAEIVAGKLGARLMPVLGLILAAAPVLSIATLFGGIDPAGVVGSLLVVLACGLFGCTLALTLSVWGRKTHQVLLATYLFGILYLLAAPIVAGLQGGLPAGTWPRWFPTFLDLLAYNPIYLTLSLLAGPMPGMSPVTLATQLRFFGLGAATSAAMFAVATWRIRRVVIRQLGQGERPRRGWRLIPSRDEVADQPGRLIRRRGALRRLVRRVWSGPSLDRNPVLWRECHRGWPSTWDVALWGLYVLLCGGGTLYVIFLIRDGRRWGYHLGTAVNAMQVAGGLLMLSVGAATSLSEERQRGSLDVLMTTPLPTWSIVWGKWRGAFRLVPRLLVLPTLLTLALDSLTGYYWGVILMDALILAYGAAITSLGLALATWMPRVGRATGTTVGLYTIMCIAWIPFSYIVFGDGPHDQGNGVAAGSPIAGVGVYSSVLADDGMPHDLFSQSAWTVFWTAAYAGVALALLLATLATFNYCLGRVDDGLSLDRNGRNSRGGKGRPAPNAIERPV